jgi:hypothetical protein
VLDKTSGTTAITAVLAALVRLERDFPDLIKKYAGTAWSRGQRVKVAPSDFVYEYEGPWKDFPNFFRLKVLNEDAWRSLPLVDVLRLEPTNLVRPKGKLNSDLGGFERGALDHLLGIMSCGNNSFIRNAVFVHMPRTQFERVADAVILTPSKAATWFPELSHFLSWGSIGPDGSLKPSDPHQVIGDPLVAVTSIPEDLALACSSAERATKVVFVDGAGRLARDLQAFDDIADSQRMIILASPDESEELELLKNRNCPIWHMSAGEMLIGESSADKRERASLVGATIRAADIRRHANVSTVECHDQCLEAAAASLECVAEMIGDREETLEVEQALGRLFGILFECSECCFGVGEEIFNDLRAAREHTVKHARWLELSVAEKLRKAIDELERAIKNGVGQQKADAFLNILTKHDGQWAVTSRSPRTVERLRKKLDGLGADVTVLPVSTMSSDHEYRGVIVPGWPNDQRFTRLKNLSVTPDIRVLAYPFERKWLLRHQARERMRMQANWMEVDKRSAILGITSSFLGDPDANNEIEPPEKRIQLDLPVFRLEERISRRRLTQVPVTEEGEEARKAQLVQFFGGCYALLTEWAELPVLNELIDKHKEDRLFVRKASELSPGDFVLFRAAGDKEFTRLIAEEIVGAEEYRQIRDIADRWKSTLRRLGSSPATVQRRLLDHGLDRALVTIAGWLGDPNRIGPGTLSDIDIIATVANDAELLSIEKEVKEAITSVRVAHQAAGMRLTNLILSELQSRLNRLGDQPELLDLGYGQAWIVQVESVAPRLQEYPASQVNRLLWSADSAF